MALYAIGDLHLSLGCDKPMDIFPGWEGYLQRLETAWRAQVQPEDTVVLAGDTSWAMKLENTYEDFAFLQSLPGKKLISKGNHDYWWNSKTKMDAWFEKNGFDSLAILHNNSYLVCGMAVCGTRSWMFRPQDKHDDKVMQREKGRLAASLQHAQQHYPQAEKLVFLHYPPLYPNADSPEMIELMRQYDVQRCYYGHLHGGMIRQAVQGDADGIVYALISADALGFSPLRILPQTATK